MGGHLPSFDEDGTKQERLAGCWGDAIFAASVFRPVRLVACRSPESRVTGT
jgi:hypothetical protein